MRRFCNLSLEMFAKWLNLITAFLIFIISLFPKVDALQLFKINELVCHYEEALQERPDLNFFVFIAEHYWNLEHKDSDHAKLPLFSISSQPVLLFFHNWLNFFRLPDGSGEALFFSFYRPPALPPGYVSQLFRPPKV
jgi:hypothetical protein